ncbi:MAG: hypothetical protein DRP67_00565 [Candidatus Omnitrophota bacterium]|nr:MAG: hypothetical protein DRP67_00565 [Candidatus Omnitrophota bacterium]
MSLSILKNLLVIELSLILLGYGEEIRVCIWKGKNPEGIVGKYKKILGNTVYLKKKNNTYFLISKIDIEKYVCGVVGKEMSPDWPFEALKAQSVCSRTIAYLKKIENSENFYDVENSIYHQVYGKCDNKRVWKAVSETKGEVLLYKGKIVPVFYHACCGGKTTSYLSVWGNFDFPWLKPVEDPFCKDSPYIKWKRVFSKRKISEILGKDIKKMEILKRDSSGRAQTLKFILKNGETLTISSQDFRMKLYSSTNRILFSNTDILPSTFFWTKDNGEEIIFYGKGYGHGVGMCQWGARKMAEKGYDYRKILKHFFPLLKIGKISKKEVYGDYSEFCACKNR